MKEELSQPPSVLGSALAASASAATEGAIVSAKRFPRDEQKCLEKILNAATRPRLAEHALYQYQRGGTDIVGPSIRLAECIAQIWGNMEFGLCERENSGGVSVMEAFAVDYETNVRQTRTFQVPHTRKARGEVVALTDPRDIYENNANMGARRLRACILGLIPGDIIDEAVAQCNATMETKEETTPENIKKMVESFGEIGVDKARIEKFIGRKSEAITPALMVRLRRVYNSIKDGMSSAEEWFPVESGPEDNPMSKKP